MNKMLERKIDSQPDLVDCPYKRCKTYGETLDCYMDLFYNCTIYIKWENIRQQFIEAKGYKLEDLGQ